VAGAPLDVGPYVAYLRSKFGAIYGLDEQVAAGR
jgi:hypothetical protein